MRDNAKKDQLFRTWALMADAVERALTAEEPSAASLEVARKWLDANGVTLEVLQSWRRNGLGFVGPLPTFNDDDETTDSPSTEANPLRVARPSTPP
ncbi:MAG: hypothetical protein BGN99_03445 [Alphaproteobacteria bacterium 65-37]|nr:MAG: hypothetical protein BGN99_03445 [Alphaproteobacteria bacterium 65-37]